MTQQDVYARLHPIFHDIFDDPSIELQPETTARDIDDWDSLAHVNLVSAIEKDFSVKFALAELQELQNVGEMVELILKKTA